MEEAVVPPSSQVSLTASHLVCRSWWIFNLWSSDSAAGFVLLGGRNRTCQTSTTELSGGETCFFWWSDSSESWESYDMLQRAKANILNTFLTFMNLLVRKAWDLSKWPPRLRCLCVFLLTCKRCWIEVPGRAKDVGEAVATCRKSKGVAVLDLCIFWRNAFEAVFSPDLLSS